MGRDISPIIHQGVKSYWLQSLPVASSLLKVAPDGRVTSVAGGVEVIGALGYTPADDANVVHKTGNETIAGVKTFSSLVNALAFVSGSATLGESGVHLVCRTGHASAEAYYGNSNAGAVNNNVYLQQGGQNRFVLGPNARMAFGPGSQGFTKAYAVHFNGANAGYGGLIITGAASSPGPLIRAEDTSGVEMFSVSAAGAGTFSGNINLTGARTIAASGTSLTLTSTGGGININSGGIDVVTDASFATFGTIRAGQTRYYTGVLLRGIVGTPSWGASYVAFQNGTIAESAVNSALNQNSAGATIVNAAAGQTLTLKIANGTKVSIDSTTAQFSAHQNFATDNSYDIGAAGANRPRNVYVAGQGFFGSNVTSSGAFVVLPAVAATPAYTFQGATNSGLTLQSTVVGSRALYLSTDGVAALTLGGSGTSRAATFSGNIAAPNFTPGVLQFFIDTSSVGAKKIYLRAPYAGTITGWELTGDAVGSLTLDVWRDTLANFPPTNADSIVASAKPSLTAQQSTWSSTLTGWSTSFVAGDIFEVEVEASSGISNATLTLLVNKA